MSSDRDNQHHEFALFKADADQSAIKGLACGRRTLRQEIP